MQLKEAEIPGNSRALSRLQESVQAGNLLGFVGAGASAGLYPLWGQLLEGMANRAVDCGRASKSDKKRWLMGTATPQVIASAIKSKLGDELFGNYIYEIFSPRRSSTGRYYTDAHSALLSIPFKGYVTTNYDPGLLEARRVERPDIPNTSYATWKDVDSVGRWANGSVFEHEKCPVLFAHGSHERSDTIVLTSEDYHAAYDGGAYQSLSELLWIRERLVFVGFGFSDPWLEFLSSKVISRLAVGRSGEPRHFAVLGLRPKEKYSPEHRTRFQRLYNAEIVYYRVRKREDGGEDHSELASILDGMRAPLAHVSANKIQHALQGARESQRDSTPSENDVAENLHKTENESSQIIQKWLHETTNDEKYVGRSLDIDRLNSWSSDCTVKVVSITGFGGLGKTSLVGHWLKKAHGLGKRPYRGVFFWSFYVDRSVSRCLTSLTKFVNDDFGLNIAHDRSPADAACSVLQIIQLSIILDGIEVLQEGPASDDYGALLDIDLREFLSAACRLDHQSLVILTSRFPFRDLARYLGAGHRAFALPFLRPEDGAELLSRCGVEGTIVARQEVSRKLEGHPLALRVFAAALAIQAERDPSRLFNLIFTHVNATKQEEPLQAKIRRLLEFYEEKLPERRRSLLRLIALFRSPIDQRELKKLARALPETKKTLGVVTDSLLRQYLHELRNEQLLLREISPNGHDLYSCHPILRDYFRSSMLEASKTAATSVADLLEDRPADEQPTDVSEIEPVLSAIELLQQAGGFVRANELYQGRLKEGAVFRTIPAAHEGLNCAFGFVSDSYRQEQCTLQLGARRTSYYLNAAGLHGAFAGELRIAVNCYEIADKYKKQGRDFENRVSGLLNQTWALAQLGRLTEALSVSNDALLSCKYIQRIEETIRAELHHAYVLMFLHEITESSLHFRMADQIQREEDKLKRGLVSLSAIWWAELFLRAGKLDVSQSKIDSTFKLCVESGWRDDVARCHMIYGSIAHKRGDLPDAELHLSKSEAIMRKGHMLTELPQVLLAKASLLTTQRQYSSALQAVDEGFELARLRGMIPCHSEALVVRSRIRLTQSFDENANAYQKKLFTNLAVDDAQMAMELGRNCGYRWSEIDAMKVLRAIVP